ncbi:MAG TPA: hypothetical protein VMY06_14770 [Sedimentisphaerales bacterium]|nr:hypothetical protein [Sedimentisphaerales bacterium]HUU15595.1 hypothetical protein [Sedimentisphaerales bacterium]
MSAIDVILIVLFIGLIVFDALVARGFEAILREIRDKLNEKAVDVDGALQNQDVLIFENKVVRDILWEVKLRSDERLLLDKHLRAAIDKIFTS